MSEPVTSDKPTSAEAPPRRRPILMALPLLVFATFAVLAYQSAWLRHYYPAEYYAALFNNQPMGFYAPHALVGDARRHNIQVLRVSINRSGPRCEVFKRRHRARPRQAPVFDAYRPSR